MQFGENFRFAMTILFYAIQTLVLVQLCYFAYLLCFMAMRNYKYDGWLTGQKYTSGVMVVTVFYQLLQTSRFTEDLSYWWCTEDDFAVNVEYFMSQKSESSFSQALNISLILLLIVLHISHALIVKIVERKELQKRHSDQFGLNIANEMPSEIPIENIDMFIQTVRAMAVLTIACFIPYFKVILIQNGVRTQIEYVTLLIAFARSAINPLICMKLLSICKTRPCLARVPWGRGCSVDGF